ncbi:hypothetical protein HDU79_011373, partial [Rhizoclosmatium sp. JEL0117]
TGLTVSIRTVRDTFRENLAAFLVSWIRDLSSCVRGPMRGSKDGLMHASIVLAVRTVICEELCSSRKKVKDSLIAEYLATANGGIVVPPGRVSGDTEMNEAGEGDDDVAMRDPSPFSLGSSNEKTRWRLDYLIGFDSRLWKSLRAAMKGLYIESLVISGEEFKKAMALRLTYTYPILADSYLIQDREYELSMMNFTVQLFTVPTIAEYLLKNTSILHGLFATLKSYFLSDHYETVFPHTSLLTAIRRANRLIRPSYTKLTFEGDRVYQKQKYAHIFNDIKFLLSAAPVRLNLFRNGNLSEFAGFLDLLRVMQGMYPQKRHIRTHVEYESQAWANSFYLGSHVSRVLECIGDAFAPTCKSRLKEDLAVLIKAIKLTLKVLDDWAAQEQLFEFKEWDEAVAERQLAAQRSGTQFIPPVRSLDGFIPVSYCTMTPPQRVLDFKSLGRSLSLHHPLHWVLAKLLACVPMYGVELGPGGVAISLKEIMTIDDVVEPKLKDLSDLSFVKDLDDWNPLDDSADTVTLPQPAPVPLLLQQISQDDHIARLMDHPLRTEVFLSQIRTGLWVRNGMSMRSQLLYFRYILLREMYDLDIFLLQSFAVLAGPDRFIATLVDRYDIRMWFEGLVTESSKKFFNDLAPSIGLAEDLLNLLVNVLTERSRIGVVGAEELARREMIHVLATSPNGLPYSKISEAIPYEITRLLQGLPTTTTSAAGSPKTPVPPMNPDDEYFFQPCKGVETILSEIAVFKPPSLSNDKGMYELKDEFYDQVDPWFHHYTRAQREEVDAILCKRIIKKYNVSPTSKLLEAAKTGSLNNQLADLSSSSWVDVNRLAQQYGLFLPRISPVLEESGFSTIDLFVGGRSFSVLLLMALNNLTRKDSQACKSDHAMASIVHLLLVALEIEWGKTIASRLNERFVDQAGVLYQFECLGPTPISLVGKVLEILDRASEDAFKDHVERLSLFILRLNSFGASKSLDQVHAWQANHIAERLAAAPVDSADAGLSEKEKRKEESKKRQAAIMAKFAQQQQSFLNTNVEGESDIDEDDEEMDAEQPVEESLFLNETRPWNFPAGSCIMCQEDFSRDNRLYGMLCFSQPCYIERSRFVDFRNPGSVLAAINTPSLTDANEVQSTAAYVPDSSNGLYQKFPRSIELYPTGEPRDTELYTSSCGHLMHSSCFEQYFNSIEARQNMENRLYAESIDRGEFLCPLCKSLGNIMLPIRNVPKTETVNWSGSKSSETDPSVGMVPLEKGGEKNSLIGLQEWFDQQRPRLAESLEKRSKMQTDEAESFAALQQASSSSSSAAATGRRRSNANTSTPARPVPPTALAAQIPAFDQFLNMIGQFGGGGGNVRRASDASVSTNSEEPRNEQTELQDLIDRLMTPLIRLTDDCLTNGLLNSLEYTISSLERSVRGLPAKNRDDLDSNPSLASVHVLEQLNNSTLTFLRVLSEAILQLNEVQSSAEDFDKGAYPDANTDLQIFFAGMDNSLYPVSNSFTPQLEFTGFSTLVGITFANEDPKVCQEPDDIFKWIGLTWSSEVIRTIVAVVKSVTIHGDSWFNNEAILKAAKASAFQKKQDGDVKGKGVANQDTEMMDVEFELTEEDQASAAQMTVFMMFIMSHMGLTEASAKSVLEAVSPSVMMSLLRSMTLPFLRSSSIYLYTRFYLVPPTGTVGFNHRVPSGLLVRDEYEQLRSYLQLPALSTLCSTASVSDPFLSRLFGNWVTATNNRELERRLTYQDQLEKVKSGVEDFDTYRLERSITLESPAVMGLIGLPTGLEVLFADCFRRTCNNCQKQISDPALCLICGTLVCALSFCCHKDKKGECNNHMKQCSGDVGVFFLIKRFKILLLHNEKGCHMDPPYLDIHGEVDVNRRKGSRQFLHLRRYDDIKKLWLTHGLPSYIARAVESVPSYGGWTQY